MIKVSADEFATFQRIFNRVAGNLGLTEWQVDFEHKKLDDGDIASISTSYTGMYAHVTLSTEVIYPFDIARIAKHEVVHLLLAGLDDVGSARWATEEDMDRENEKLARRLEKVL